MEPKGEQSVNEKIDDRLKVIESKIDQVLPEVENVLAHRVYQAAKERLSKSAKLFGVFLAMLIGAVGYQSYKQIIDIGGTKVAEVLAESVVPELQKDVEEQVDARLKELMVEARVQANAKLDQQIAKVSAIYQDKFNLLLKELEIGNVASIDASKTVQKLVGYVLYGEGEKGEDGKWVWSKRSFSIEGVHPDAFPEAGQILVSDNPVLVRDKPPSVRYETKEIRTKVPIIRDLKLTFQEKIVSKTKIPVLEETSSKPIGTLSTGKKVAIKSVQTVLGGYVWVDIEEL